MEVSAIKYEHISAVHKRMSAAPVQANRTLSLLSKLFTMAEIWGWRELATNPCRGIRRFPETKRRRYMTDSEAPRIADVLVRYDAKYPKAVAFIRLLILTGARPSEIATAELSWIDGDVLTLPDSKTGERSIYLPKGVAKLFDVAGPPRRQIPYYVWEQIRLNANCPDLRLYDLRHTFASAALKAGYTLDQIGELLGHRNANTTKRYAHLMSDKALEIANATSAVLEEMMA